MQSQPTDTPSPPETGAALIAEKSRTLPLAPGVYRMLSAKGETLYVGKARQLRKRVESYGRPQRQPLRIARMIAQTADMEFTLTNSEAEALLLEAALIKRFRPPFNVLLRDDKSFPYIALVEGKGAARLIKHRGKQSLPGDYFGPFVSAGVVERSLLALQRAFLLRSCSDAVYAARTRPCLLYQIKRCAAPCTGEISAAEYKKLASDAKRFLRGESRQVQENLAAQMEQAAANEDYERAAACRDRLKVMEEIQGQPGRRENPRMADLFALARAGQRAAAPACVEVFLYRGGQPTGNRAYFPRHPADASDEEILQSFIAQFYETRPAPPLVLVSHDMESAPLLAEALALHAGHKVRLRRPQRGSGAQLLANASTNAAAAAARRFAEATQQKQLLAALANKLNLPHAPKRIEIYDNSHIQGSDPIGAMVCATPEGFRRNAYRLFNIKEASPQDDVAMMREVFSRRFARLAKEQQAGEVPDLILVDGGATQRRAAVESIKTQGFEKIPVLAIAKGPERNAGREQFYFGGKPFSLPPHDPLLFYLQRLRDEAHRFAIARHRAKRKRRQFANPLDAVAGIGAARKRALIRRFGSARRAASASVDELQSVPGISAKLAQLIYNHFSQ